MAWQPRKVDNTPRTPNKYVRHDVDCVVAPLHADYVRYTEENVVESPQPISSVQYDDYGNRYVDWNGDYSGWAPLGVSGQTTLLGDFSVGGTINMDSYPIFVGGIEPLTTEAQWQKSLDGVSGWSGFGSGWIQYDQNNVIQPSQILGAAEDGYYIRLRSRATDSTLATLTAPAKVYGPVLTVGPNINPSPIN